MSRAARIGKQLVESYRRIDRRLARLGGRCCVGRSQRGLERARRRAA